MTRIPQVSILLYHRHLLSDPMPKDVQVLPERMTDGDPIKRYGRRLGPYAIYGDWAVSPWTTRS